MEPPGSCQSCRRAVTETRLVYRRGDSVVHNPDMLQCDICERYALPYNSGRFSKQWFTVHRSIFRLAFPGGKPRPKPGPYRSPERRTGPGGPSEASRFRERVPAEHPNAGPEHESGGVDVQPPPRGKD